MNKGNSVKSFRKWLFSLEILDTKEFADGVKFELRNSLEEGLVIIRYEDGIYDCSLLESDYSKYQFDNLLADIGFDRF